MTPIFRSDPPTIFRGTFMGERKDQNFVSFHRQICSTFLARSGTPGGGGGRKTLLVTK